MHKHMLYATWTGTAKSMEKERTDHHHSSVCASEPKRSTIYDMMMMVKIHMSLKKPVKLDLLRERSTSGILQPVASFRCVALLTYIPEQSEDRAAHEP
jgi:hypothetical protein